MRTTRKELESLTATLATAIDVDLILTHNSTYGGWKLAKSHGRFGGQAHFGDAAHIKAADMAYALRLAIDAVIAAQHEHTWGRRTESARTDEVWSECKCGAVRR